MIALDQAQYERLLRFRTGLRRFLRWSAEQAALAGQYLFLRHHSAVELVDRAQAAGLVERRTDPADARAVRLGLTALGKNRLDKLATAHLKELARLESELHALWEGLDTTVDARTGSN